MTSLIVLLTVLVFFGLPSLFVLCACVMASVADKKEETFAGTQRSHTEHHEMLKRHRQNLAQLSLR